MLAEWRMGGWVEMMGRKPTPDDLIVPSRDGKMRSRHHSRNKLLEDLTRLGLRPRRGHDLRRTMISLARADGARTEVLERITHRRKGSVMMDVYTEFTWEVKCAELSKLNIRRRSSTPSDASHTATPSPGQATG